LAEEDEIEYFVALYLQSQKTELLKSFTFPINATFGRHTYHPAQISDIIQASMLRWSPEAPTLFQAWHQLLSTRLYKLIHHSCHLQDAFLALASCSLLIKACHQ
jgi:hypothetical protein